MNNKIALLISIIVSAVILVWAYWVSDKPVVPEPVFTTVRADEDSNNTVQWDSVGHWDSDSFVVTKPGRVKAKSNVVEFSCSPSCGSFGVFTGNDTPSVIWRVSVIEKPFQAIYKNGRSYTISHNDSTYATRDSTGLWTIKGRYESILETVYLFDSIRLSLDSLP